MLRDKKELLINEITKLQTSAAEMYKQIAINGKLELEIEYQQLVKRLTDFQAELKQVDELINNGEK